MAIVNTVYELRVITKAELTELVGDTVNVSSQGASIPTINIQVDDAEKEGIIDTLDEVMLKRGYVRTSP